MKTTKKVFLLVVLAISMLVVGGCSKTNSADVKIGSDKKVLKAIDTLTDFWEDEYARLKIDDKYLKIIDTKIINIKNDIDAEDVHNKLELFEDIDYIVEFELLSNYYDTTPYYSNTGTNNCVIVYDDGTMKVNMSLLTLYRSNTYSNDFSPIIDSIEYLESQYNHVIKIK